VPRRPAFAPPALRWIGAGPIPSTLLACNITALGGAAAFARIDTCASRWTSPNPASRWQRA
jgi:hypothetical protein